MSELFALLVLLAKVFLCAAAGGSGIVAGLRMSGIFGGLNIGITKLPGKRHD